MGLSSKQVSNRGLDWNQTLLQAQNLELPKAPPMRKQQQQQNQQLEAVKCPRCDSTNTKFCYYNNYNKSQPRHFCRSCKRHWTKGGTLRNIPVGGGRKNKRVKKSASPKSSTTITATNSISITTSNANNNIDAEFGANMTIQSPQQRQNLPTLAVGDQKSLPSSLYQSMIHPPSLLPQQNLMSTRESEGKDFGIGNGIFLSSTMPFPQNKSNLFPFSNSTSFDTNTCAVSTPLRSSIVYNHVEEFKIMEEPTINSTMPSTSTQPWEMPATSTGMEMSNYWSWEDIDSLVSTDLNATWDDSDIKP